jgi:hypothetical protein
VDDRYALFLIQFWTETILHGPEDDMKTKVAFLSLQVGRTVCVFRYCLGPVGSLISISLFHVVAALLIFSFQVHLFLVGLETVTGDMTFFADCESLYMV